MTCFQNFIVNNLSIINIYLCYSCLDIANLKTNTTTETQLTSSFKNNQFSTLFLWKMAVTTVGVSFYISNPIVLYQMSPYWEVDLAKQSTKLRAIFFLGRRLGMSQYEEWITWSSLGQATRMGLLQYGSFAILLWLIWQNWWFRSIAKGHHGFKCLSCQREREPLLCLQPSPTLYSIPTSKPSLVMWIIRC